MQGHETGRPSCLHSRAYADPVCARQEHQGLLSRRVSGQQDAVPCACLLLFSRQWSAAEARCCCLVRTAWSTMGAANMLAAPAMELR